MPIVIGGGPCTYNAEPVADFFDVFSIGEGEEALPEIMRLYADMKESGEYTKKEFLRRAAKLNGFYVPSLYDVSYNDDGTIKAYTPVYDDIPTKITKRIIKDMDKAFFPDKMCIRDSIKSGRAIDKLLVRRGDREGSITVIAAECISRKIPVIEVEKAKLDSLSGGKMCIRDRLRLLSLCRAM